MTASLEQEITIAIVTWYATDAQDYVHWSIYNMRSASPEFCTKFLLEQIDIVYAPTLLIKSIGDLIVKRRVEALLSPVDWIRNWASGLGSGTLLGE